MNNSPQRRWFTAAETAAYFRLPKKTLYSLAARGQLPEGSVIRLGRQLRFDIAAIERSAKIKSVAGRMI